MKTLRRKFNAFWRDGFSFLKVFLKLKDQRTIKRNAIILLTDHHSMIMGGTEQIILLFGFVVRFAPKLRGSK